MEIEYTAYGSATGGRVGRGASSDKAIDVALTMPKEMGGPGGAGTNPEQLFAVGYSACFLGALKFTAMKEKIKVADEAEVKAAVGIGPRDDGTGFGIAVTLTIHIPGMSIAAAEELVKKADVVCPYSHALRGNVAVQLSVV